MDLIKVNKIEFGNIKDTIEVSTLEGFEKINDQLFNGGIVFNLNGRYYLLGDQVAYIFKKK